MHTQVHDKDKNTNSANIFLKYTLHNVQYFHIALYVRVCGFRDCSWRCSTAFSTKKYVISAIAYLI